MTEPATAQIYLATPLVFDADQLAAQIAQLIEIAPIACIRLRTSSVSEAEILRQADALREVAHPVDVPIVIDDHFRLVERSGLDGVHLIDGHRKLREARSALGGDAIIGAYCDASRHSGLTAGEIGADYVSFGPVSDTGGLGDGTIAEPELFSWWSEMVEVPVVAEGGVTPQMAQILKDKADFLMLCDEIWASDDPVKRFREFVSPQG